MPLFEKGAYPVLPTPFRNDGEIDDQGFRAVLSYALASSAQGVVFPGFASECDQLDLNERVALIQEVGSIASETSTFIVGASANSADDTINLAIAGWESGAAATMIMAPRDASHTAKTLVDYFSAICEAVPIPIILQNAPTPTGANLSVDMILDVVRSCPCIAYVKEEAPPYGQRVQAIRQHANGALLGVFGGAGGRYIVDELNRGSIGTMPACELIEVHSRLVKAHTDGKIDEARDLFEMMLPILNMQAVFRWSLTKEILKHRGLIQSTFVRAPGPRLDDEDKAELYVLLRRMESQIGKLPHAHAAP